MEADGSRKLVQVERSLYCTVWKKIEADDDSRWNIVKLGVSRRKSVWNLMEEVDESAYVSSWKFGEVVEFIEERNTTDFQYMEVPVPVEGIQWMEVNGSQCGSSLNIVEPSGSWQKDTEIEMNVAGLWL